MRNAAGWVVVTLALGGCRLFMPSATATPETRASDQAETEADAAMARWTAAQADVEVASAALAAALDKARAYEEEAKKLDGERNAYFGAIEAARDAARGCSGRAELLSKIYRVLVEYVPDPQRDAAISSLEPCRRAAATARKAELDQSLPALRADYVTALQARFDEQHPEHRGKLIGKIKGDTLDVSTVEFSAWDAARSQAELDTWCAETSSFTSITLRTAGAKFTCRPKESPKALTARLLEESGLTRAWVPVPPGTKQPPPPETAEEKARIDAIAAEMEAANKQLDLAEAALEQAAADGKAAVEDFEAKVKSETAN